MEENLFMSGEFKTFFDLSFRISSSRSQEQQEKWETSGPHKNQSLSFPGLPQQIQLDLNSVKYESEYLSNRALFPCLYSLI